MTTVAMKMSNKQFTLAVGQIKYLKIKNGRNAPSSALEEQIRTRDCCIKAPGAILVNCRESAES
jgi:hypothetical protein